MKDRANWLVVAQFVLLALLLLPGDPLWAGRQATVLAVLLVITGLVLSGAGVVALGRDLVPWVAPREGATLKTDGVFRLTRNPIYVGLLIAAAGWVIWRARIELIVVWVLLAVVLVVKAHLEQHRLLDRFGDAYREYADRTPLLLWARGIR
ncbi:methyltransferase family protein [Agromyces binzhouensis]|uniref:Isoprenylcysteine carboxylmethyltransferase family protein n=1 Tax=Agromyces binzhouensis TaxID=1817495 RepID=A0A4Q2JC04_9MICO|nr:isoprenylcysteine carboxylmethyltransferase family protein [Agromyces binzhouensis]RXZ43776.1 isoprenylcysteine carboxylmethyltransferase family protein [Agromyces binzhouensis]